MIIEYLAHGAIEAHLRWLETTLNSDGDDMEVDGPANEDGNLNRNATDLQDSESRCHSQLVLQKQEDAGSRLLSIFDSKYDILWASRSFLPVYLIFDLSTNHCSSWDDIRTGNCGLLLSSSLCLSFHFMSFLFAKSSFQPDFFHGSVGFISQNHSARTLASPLI